MFYPVATFPAGVESIGVGAPQNLLGEGSSQYMGGASGGEGGGLKYYSLNLGKILEKHLWRGSFVSKVASYKPASL